jgi:glycerophosphoryl diester phosphodiesterase
MGIEVNVWTVDKIDIANELWNWGADGVITNMTQRYPGHEQKGDPNYGHFLKFWE